MNLWKKYKETVRKNCSGSSDAVLDLPGWRNRLFADLILYILPFSLIALIPGVSISLDTGVPLIALADTVTVLSVLIIAFSRGLSVELRKSLFIFVCYVLAVVLLYYLGIFGVGLLYLLAITLVTILIFSQWISFLSVVINAALCTLLGLLIHWKILNAPITIPFSFASSIAVFSNLIFLSALFTVLVPMLFNGLQKIISEQNQLQKELSENEKRFRSLVENGTDAVAILTADIRPIYVSPSIKRILGYSEDEFLQFELVTLVYPEDWPGVQKSIGRVLANPGIPLPGCTSRLLHKNGTWRWFESTVTNLIHEPSIAGIVDNFRDITERMEAETHKEFERRDKEALINSTNDLIWSVGKDLRLIAANQPFTRSVERYAGLTLKPGDHILPDDFFPEDFLTLWKGYYNRALDGENFMTEIHTPKNPNSEESWSEITFGPIYNEDKVFAVVCYGRVTTDRKIAEEKLKQSHEFLQKITENVPAALYQFEINPEGKRRFPFMSKGLQFILPDLNVQSVKEDATSAFEKVHPDDALKLQTSIEDSRENLTDWDLEYRTFTSNGRVVWLKGSSHPEKKEDGTVVWYGYLMDITERKKQEQELAEFNEKKVSILESIQDGFYSLDKEDTVTYWNSEAERLLGVKREWILGKKIYEFYNNEASSRFYSQIGAVRNTKQPARFQEQYFPSERWYDVAAFPLGDGLTVYFKEITNLKNAENQLKAANSDLEQKNMELAVSNKELEQFAYIASHDLQEPLRMVTSFLSKIEEKYEPLLDDKGKKYIYLAVDGATRMRQIILDLLEYSRAGKMIDNLTQVNVNELLADIQVLYREIIQEKGAVLKFDSLPIIIGAKPAIHQLFRNLIGNSLKYSKEDEKPVILITGKETPTHFQFSVEDNGIGIDPQFFEKIFVLFQRLHDKSEYSGTGIGLSICKKIIERHKGEIWLDSSENKGTVFNFTISKDLS